jgi:DNA-binding NarL/FixJ family response regulator
MLGPTLHISASLERESMLEARGKLLIVDEDDSIRTSLSPLFSQLGYHVRSCGDGFSALAKIREEIPNVMLADLSMAGIPVLEFLMVVRRWFPSVRVIAMGGAFSGNRVLAGVAADAFYQKGAGPARLIEQVDAMTQPKRFTSRLSMQNLFGFQVYEAIPPHPGTEPLTFPANPTLVFPLPQREQPGKRTLIETVIQTQKTCSL